MASRTLRSRSDWWTGSATQYSISGRSCAALSSSTSVDPDRCPGKSVRNVVTVSSVIVADISKVLGAKSLGAMSSNSLRRPLTNWNDGRKFVPHASTRWASSTTIARSSPACAASNRGSFKDPQTDSGAAKHKPCVPCTIRFLINWWSASDIPLT